MSSSTLLLGSFGESGDEKRAAAVTLIERLQVIVLLYN